MDVIVIQMDVQFVEHSLLVMNTGEFFLNNVIPNDQA